MLTNNSKCIERKEESSTVTTNAYKIIAVPSLIVATAAVAAPAAAQVDPSKLPSGDIRSGIAQGMSLVDLEAMANNKATYLSSANPICNPADAGKRAHHHHLADTVRASCHQPRAHAFAQTYAHLYPRSRSCVNWSGTGSLSRANPAGYGCRRRLGGRRRDPRRRRSGRVHPQPLKSK